MNHQQWLDQPRIKSNELLDIFPEAREYLEKDLKKSLLFKSAFEMLIRYRLEEISNIKDEFSNWFSTEILRITDGSILDKHERRIKQLNFLLNPQEINNGIEREHIDNAKKFPFENLLKFKNGFAPCPFHEEKTASFHIRNNYATCFGCGWQGDVIKFVMEYYNLNFIKAVKQLQ